MPSELAEFDPRKSWTVALRFFGGPSVNRRSGERPSNTVMRDGKLARPGWLTRARSGPFRELSRAARRALGLRFATRHSLTSRR